MPSDITVKEFPAYGGVALSPVIQLIELSFCDCTIHYIPSILTETLAPKLVPAIVIVSDPKDDPN